MRMACLHDERCMADAVKDQADGTLDQKCMQIYALQHCHPGHENPDFWSIFVIRSHWFTITSSKNIQGTSPYIWRPAGSDCIYFMQLATFITQNRLFYINITRRCAPYGVHPLGGRWQG